MIVNRWGGTELPEALSHPVGTLGHMENQLHLRISTERPSHRDWQLDDSTREAGRSGIALARAALEQARRARVVAEGSRAGQSGDDHTTAA